MHPFAHNIICKSLQETHPHNITDVALCIALDVNLSIDLRSLPIRTPNGNLLLFRITSLNQDINLVILKRDIDFLRNLALQTHQVMIALLHHILGYLIWHHRSRCVLLLGVGKYPNLIEALFLYKGTKSLIVRVRLPRKTNNKRRANRHSRNVLTQFFYQFLHS